MKILNKNSFPEGLIIGFVIPLVGFAVLFAIFYGLESITERQGKAIFSENFMYRTAGIVAIGLNALPMNKAFKKKFTDTMRGIVVFTFVFIVIWVIYFWKSVF